MKKSRIITMLIVLCATKAAYAVKTEKKKEPSNHSTTIIEKEIQKHKEEIKKHKKKIQEHRKEIQKINKRTATIDLLESLLDTSSKDSQDVRMSSEDGMEEHKKTTKNDGTPLINSLEKNNIKNQFENFQDDTMTSISRERFHNPIMSAPKNLVMTSQTTMFNGRPSTDTSVQPKEEPTINSALLIFFMNYLQKTLKKISIDTIRSKKISKYEILLHLMPIYDILAECDTDEKKRTVGKIYRLFIDSVFHKFFNLEKRIVSMDSQEPLPEEEIDNQNKVMAQEEEILIHHTELIKKQCTQNAWDEYNDRGYTWFEYQWKKKGWAPSMHEPKMPTEPSPIVVQNKKAVTAKAPSYLEGLEGKDFFHAHKLVMIDWLQLNSIIMGQMDNQYTDNMYKEIEELKSVLPDAADLIDQIKRKLKKNTTGIESMKSIEKKLSTNDAQIKEDSSQLMEKLLREKFPLFHRVSRLRQKMKEKYPLEFLKRYERHGWCEGVLKETKEKKPSCLKKNPQRMKET